MADMAFVAGQLAAAGSTAAGTTVAAAFPGNVTSGNLLTCTTRTSVDDTHTISDDLADGVPWVEDNTVLHAVDLHRSRVFSKKAGASAACTVTLTTGTSQRRGLTIREFTNPATTHLDDAATGQGADASVECGSVTLANQGAILSAWSYQGGQTTTLDTDYVSLVENTTGRVGCGHRISAAATDEAVHTASAINNWAGLDTAYVSPAPVGGATFSGYYGYGG